MKEMTTPQRHGSRRWPIWAVVFCIFAGPGGWSVPGAEETFEFGAFGRVTLYRSVPQPSQVVLFLSGDGGWNLGVVEMARALSSLDAVVAGIDVTHYLQRIGSQAEACSYPAGDLENLSKYLQKKLDFPNYKRPILVGYSSGATLVYAALAQAPANTFQGAISMGFCPDLTLPKPLCSGSHLESTRGAKPNLYLFSPAPKLETPWIAFQGAIDQVCDATAAARFVKQTGTAEIVLLPKVGHGFSVSANWLPQLKEAFQRLSPRPAEPPPTAPLAPATLGDLPLVELPAPGSGPLMAVIVSGDGGWAGIDRQIGEQLVTLGVPVVGLDSLSYFWRKRTPEEAARDLGRVLEHFLAEWDKREAILIGYSFGADVLPFIVNRLSDPLSSRVRLLALLGPGQRASFEFHVLDWLGGQAPGSLPTLPELEKLRGRAILCLSGSEESESLCDKLPKGLGKAVRLPGGHHFGGDYKSLADRILEESR